MDNKALEIELLENGNLKLSHLLFSLEKKKKKKKKVKR
jgi:hypothetical protein